MRSFSPAPGSRRRPPATTRSRRPPATREQQRVQPLPDSGPLPLVAGAASRSPPNRSRARPATASTRHRCRDKQDPLQRLPISGTACDPDSESGAAVFGSNGSTSSHNSSETIHGATAIGTPSLTTDADGIRHQPTGPFIQKRVLRRRAERAIGTRRSNDHHACTRPMSARIEATRFLLLPRGGVAWIPGGGCAWSSDHD